MTSLLVLFLVFILISLGYGLFFYSGFSFFGNQITHISTQKPVVALTFDDGPNEPYTSELLGLLKRLNVKATFFMVGRAVERYPKVAKAIVDDGHSIGNHTYTHRVVNLITPKSLSREIEKTNEAIFKATGVRPRLFRSPKLFRWPLLGRYLKQKQMPSISGTFSHQLETWQPSADKMARAAKAKVRPGSIIIFHDGHNGKGASRKQTILAVELLVKQLKNDGYEFETVDKLLNIPA